MGRCRLNQLTSCRPDFGLLFSWFGVLYLSETIPLSKARA